jgi:hypothetical protein
MQITEQTPRKQATVAGVAAMIPVPFVAGHSITEGEANALNQILIENVRNNVTARAKAAKEKNAEFDVQASINEYVPAYEFGARSVAFRITDPVEKLINQFAKDKVSAALRAKNIKLSSVPADKMAELVENYATKYGPQLRTLAEARVQEEASLALAELDM